MGEFGDQVLLRFLFLHSNNFNNNSNNIKNKHFKALTPKAEVFTSEILSIRGYLAMLGHVFACTAGGGVRLESNG